MSNTNVTIKNESFLINGKKTYNEISNSGENVKGLLLNARFIQGIFDDKNAPERFARFGKTEFSPLQNTKDLIAALPEWYDKGLRAFTVGFQGGGPCFTIENPTISNNPFGENGLDLDPDYAERMDMLVKAADEIGMVVIISFFYGFQTHNLIDGRAIRNAVTTGSRFIKERNYSNVLIEVANEYNIGPFSHHPIVQTDEGIAALIDLARIESDGRYVSSSGSGRYIKKQVAEASDYVLFHGNGCTRQIIYNTIRKIKSWNLNKPIVCNEDSQSLGNMAVAVKNNASWGYYNNMTKQEPPANWHITPGEDTFFTYRMAKEIGLEVDDIAEEDQYYLQGFEPDMHYEGKRWIRLASLYPEKIDYVEFYRNNKLFYVSYVEPFSIYFVNNWKQLPYIMQPDDKEWKAVIYLKTGEVFEKNKSL